MPIGPSGCGKSTLYTQLQNIQQGLHMLSYDSMRCLLYGNDYAKAWKAANNDVTFHSQVKNTYVGLLNDNCNIYIDNTNLSPKVRNYWLTEAKRYGYTTIGILFDVDIEILISRQASRQDKTVPHNAVYQQFDALKLPINGEFDIVTTSEYIQEVINEKSWT